MFENNSPLVRQSNIFREIKNFSKSNDIDIPYDSSELTVELISEFKKYDSSTEFVLEIFHLYDFMVSDQMITMFGAITQAMDVVNYGETKERNKNTIHITSGKIAANAYVNVLFDLDWNEPYGLATGKLPAAQRSNYLLHLMACYLLEDKADKFQSYLDSSQLIIFKDISTKCKKIRSYGKKLYAEKEALLKQRETINAEYNDKGFIYFEDGSVEMMDFDKWAEENGYTSEYEQIGKALEELCVPRKDIIQKGLVT